jgi:hypothetical protein
VCNHVQRLDPYALWWLFEQRRRVDRISEVHKRFHCVPCRIAGDRKVRPRIRVTDNKPTDDTLQRPGERTWVKSVKRGGRNLAAI